MTESKGVESSTDGVLGAGGMGTAVAEDAAGAAAAAGAATVTGAAATADMVAVAGAATVMGDAPAADTVAAVSRAAIAASSPRAEMFTNRELVDLIVPLFFEQLLLALVGVADVFVTGFVGEAAVSGVSLVNSFNTIFLNLFTALAAGGAVVISQYIGRRDPERAGATASQLLVSSVIFSVAVMIIMLVFNERLMVLMFGQVEPDVMDACVTYLRISAYSYPALAIYNAGAALYRSFGKTSVTMYVSIVANIVNLVGNCIGVFVLHAGVEGVAWPSLISRTLSAVVITILCFSKANPVQYLGQWLVRVDAGLQAKMLRIAVPNGVESAVFQLVKVALSSMVALFGTYQVAANGVAQSIWNVAALVNVAMGSAFITVIGQCMGAGDTDQAEYYFRKLIKVTLLFSSAWSVVTFLLTLPLMQVYALSDQTKQLIILLVLVHNFFDAFAPTFADPLGKGLRATGDVAFTTGISLFTTIGVRLVFAYLFAIVFDWKALGVCFAMAMDWCVRGVIFWWRFKQGGWKTRTVL